MSNRVWSIISYTVAVYWFVWGALVAFGDYQPKASSLVIMAATLGVIMLINARNLDRLG